MRPDRYRSAQPCSNTFRAILRERERSKGHFSVSVTSGAESWYDQRYLRRSTFWGFTGLVGPTNSKPLSYDGEARREYVESTMLMMGQTNEHPFLILIIMSTFDPTSSYDEQERRLLILYATETGNAQDIADRVARAARRLQFRSQIMSVDCYSLVCRFSIMVHIFCLKPFLSWQENLIIEELVIFVVSTTGSGIEPRSMTPLWNRLLSSRLPTDSFEDLSFAVFGLGDTSYEKFCWAAKLLSKRLKTLGATEICERGEGDEQHPLGWVFSFVIAMRYLYHHFYRLDGAFEPWVDILSEAMLRLYPILDTLPIASTSKLPPPRVTLKSPEEGVELVPLYPTGALPVTLNKNDRITAQDWDQDVRHIELKSEQDVKCVPSLRLSGRGLTSKQLSSWGYRCHPSSCKFRWGSRVPCLYQLGQNGRWTPDSQGEAWRFVPWSSLPSFLLSHVSQIKVFRLHFWIHLHSERFLPTTLISMLCQGERFFSIFETSLLMT